MSFWNTEALNNTQFSAAAIQYKYYLSLLTADEAALIWTQTDKHRKISGTHEMVLVESIPIISLIMCIFSPLYELTHVWELQRNTSSA